MKYTPIPKRSDKSINFDAYRNLHEQTRKFIGTKFDPTYFHTIEDPTDIYVTLTGDTTSGSEFNHHFKTTSASATTFAINEGYWRRNGVTSSYAGQTVDPITAGIISDSFVGDVYNYIIRTTSYGATDDLVLFTTENPIVNADASRSFTHMEELISVVTYALNTQTGLNYIEEISQNLVGSIDDKYEMGTDFENFGLDLDTDINAFVTITVGAGDLKRRNVGITSVGGNSSTVQAAPICVYLQLGGETETPDPSLIPYSPSVIISNAFPADTTYAHLFFKLYYITSNTVVNGAGDEYDWVSVRRFHVGAVYDDWMRPDGQISGLANVDAGSPNGKTLDFVGSGEHEGELQDYYFYEDVSLDGLGFFSSGGDQVIPWYEWSAGTTEKTYCRLDSVNNSAHNCGQSLWIDGGRFELYKFLAGNDHNVLDVTTESPDPVRFLVRIAAGGDLPVLKYADLSAMKVYDSYNADYADFADSVGSGVIDDVIDQILPLDHSSLTGLDQDDHTQYVILDGSSTRNNMSGVIGDSGGTQSLEPNARKLYADGMYYSLDWSARTLNDMSGNTTVAWDAWQLNDGTNVTLNWSTRQLLFGSWTVEDTTVASLGGGAFVVKGGMDVAKEVWADAFVIRDATSVTNARWDAAGVDIEPTGSIYFWSGTTTYLGSTGKLTLETGSADGMLLKTTGGDLIVDAKHLDISSAGYIGINSGGTSKVAIYSADEILLTPVAGKRVNSTTGFATNGVEGLDIDGHSGGILVDAGAMAASTDTAVNDLMIGYTLL